MAIDNSITEQAIRPIPVGRKNFPFAGGERGGRTIETLMSVVGSARLRGLNVTRYLQDVIDRIAGIAIRRLPAHLPDRWGAAEAPTTELTATTTLAS